MRDKMVGRQRCEYGRAGRQVVVVQSIWDPRERGLGPAGIRILEAAAIECQLVPVAVVSGDQNSGEGTDTEHLVPPLTPPRTMHRIYARTHTD